MLGLRPYHNARYAKLRRQRKVWELKSFDNVFVERWIRRLTAVGYLNITLYLCRTCEKVIKKLRRYFLGIIDTNMNKARRGYHAIFILAYKVVMSEIGSYRRNENIIGSDFPLCPRWKRASESLHTTKSPLYNGSGVNIINMFSTCYRHIWRWVDVCKLNNLHERLLSCK